mgnify:CR=1 FL=1
MRVLLLVSLLYCTNAFAYEYCGESLKALDKVEAHYPRIKARPLHKGRVVLSFILRDGGVVDNISVLESQSEPSSAYLKYFERSAKEAIRKTNFSASRIPCEGEYEVRFDLRN